MQFLTLGKIERNGNFCVIQKINIIYVKKQGKTP